MNTYKQLSAVLEEMGFILFEDDADDFDISDYIADSYNFIEFIINVENKFNMELSEDFLSYDLLKSAKGLADKIDYYMSEQAAGPVISVNAVEC